MRILISVLFVIVIAVADIFLFREGVFPVEPSLTILPVLCFLVLFQRKYFSNIYLLDKNTGFFFIALMILSIIYAPFSDYDNVWTSIGLFVISVFLYISAFVFFIKTDVKIIRIILLIALFLLGSSMLFDLFFKYDYVTRGAGFAENPNGAALRISYIVVPLLHLINNKINKTIVLIMGFLLIFLTLSRSGFFLYTTIIMLSIASNNNTLFLNANIKKRFFKTVLIIFVFGLFFYSMIGFLVEIIPAFQTETVAERIDQLSGKKSLVSESDQEEGGRLNLIRNYVALVLENPLGYGTGMSSNRDFYHAATHNLFLRVFIDFGIFGFFTLFLFILRGIKIGLNEKNIYYLTFFSLIFLSSFFTNTLIENRTFIITLAVMNVLRLKKINYENL
jgi:hypothetical protein